MQIQPYLFFEGRCEEAIEFYRGTLGAEMVMLMRNSQSPVPHPPGMLPPGAENKVMHASIRIGESTINMSDGHCSKATKFQGFSLALTAPDDASAKRTFDALAEGGQIGMPLNQTFFASSFGMLTDKFGVEWMVMVPTAG